MDSSVHGARTIGSPYWETVQLDLRDRIKSRCLKNMKVKGKLKILQSKMGVFLWPQVKERFHNRKDKSIWPH